MTEGDRGFVHPLDCLNQNNNRGAKNGQGLNYKKGVQLGSIKSMWDRKEY